MVTFTNLIINFYTEQIQGELRVAFLLVLLDFSLF